MKYDIHKNAKRGIAFGILNRIISLLVPFLLQTVLIYSLGAQYGGIKGLFSSILSVLNLSELGVGTAIVYSMYKPIAEDDIDTICALLKLYKKLYRIIGAVILFLGLAVTPFVKYLIHGAYPEEINLQLVFLLYLINSVLSYWLFAYKASLLSAYQKSYVLSNIASVITVLTAGFQIIILLTTHNFYWYLGVGIAFTIISNFSKSLIVDKMFPEISCRGVLSPETVSGIRKSVGGLMIGKLCGTTRNTFDTIFMSMFLGLTQTAIYANYFHILTSLNGFTAILFSSLLAGIGNRIVTESVEKNYRQMMKINSVYMIISGWMTVCMLCLYQPFMWLWMGENLMFSENTMVLFPLYFYLLKLGDTRAMYSDAAGLFWENRYRQLLEAGANLVLNYALVRMWGAFGILLATIITIFFIGFIGSTLVIFRHYFKTGIKNYFLHQANYFVATTLVCTISYLVCKMISPQMSIMSLLIRTIICCLLSPGLFWLLLRKNDEAREASAWALKAIRKRA